MSKPQQTIEKAVSYQGIGLRSGEPVHMVFRPAPEATGIVFVRTDIEGQPSVRAHIDNVTNTMRATTLENGEAKVFTVEHVMAAFSAMNIDNCYIEMDSPEPAVGDGSSAIFVGLIEEAGIQEQTAPRHVYKITRSHTIYDGDRFVVILPYDGYRITFTSVNSHPLLGTQNCDFEVSPESFKEHISAARTIGFMKELEQKKIMTQYMNPPIILSLSMVQQQAVEENLELLESLGYQIENFGGKEYAVSGVPANLPNVRSKDLLIEIIDSMTAEISGKSRTPQMLKEKIASMSCKAAVKGNMKLSVQEVDALIGELLSLDNPYHCPHGRPTIIAMTKRELEKKFKRIV